MTDTNADPVVQRLRDTATECGTLAGALGNILAMAESPDPDADRIAAYAREVLERVAPYALPPDVPAAHDDLGAAPVLCGDRNLCARPYRHAGGHESFDHNQWEGSGREIVRNGGEAEAR